MGGIYVDFDYECLAPFDPYITDESICYFAMEPEQHLCSSGQSFCIHNALMITPVGHPFFKHVIEHLQTTSVSYTGEKYQEVLNSTGAWMVTSLYENISIKIRSTYCLPNRYPHF
ncbi:MAG: hypothetical protein LUG96_11360 [Tannerellaceae bacterium]|nr:hypothetical protein [Tannerellaceae bacterium]